MAVLGFILFVTPFVFGAISETDPAAWTSAATTAWAGGLLLVMAWVAWVAGILTVGIASSALLGRSVSTWA
jgi:hypothetical protein